MITEGQVRQALKNFYAPEVGVNVVDLGLVYGIEIEGSRVYIDMTLTSPGCPVGPQIIRSAQREVGTPDCLTITSRYSWAKTSP